MDVKKLRRSAMLAIFMIILLLLCLTTATFAWFSAANNRVKTNRVTTSTGGSELIFQVSSDGSSFGDEAELLPLTPTDTSALLPVSTADLLHFVYNPHTTDKNADIFLPVFSEERYFHGQIVLKQDSVGTLPTPSVGIYLDEDFLADANVSGQILNAARLGFILWDNWTGAPLETRILRLSDAINTDGAVLNTVLNGELQDGNIVLGSDNSGNVYAVDDPSEFYRNFCISEPGCKPLFTVDASANTASTYTLDVFFYLEGCDPDCSDSISLDSMDLSLRLFAQLLW